MPRVTALRHVTATGAFEVDLDGRPWRALPAEVVAAAGLATGVELTRAVARAVGQELRRADALSALSRSLGRRDRSRAGLEADLLRRGTDKATLRQALELADGLSLVDDRRLASSLAGQLARRGYGDGLILARLDHEGVPADLAAEAIVGLEPEIDRARTLLARLASEPRRAADALQRRGFEEDTIRLALPSLDG